jgi:ATP-binding cassette, subfamily B, bacterial
MTGLPDRLASVIESMKRIQKQDSVLNFDLRTAIHSNRLIGLWRLMSGYHAEYIAATIFVGLAALSKTLTYLLLQYFVDHMLVPGAAVQPVIFIALGFVGLAVLQGLSTFLSGMYAARTAEGSTRRLRNYLFDQIQHLNFAYHAQTGTGELIQRCTSDVDAIRRFYSDQAIGVGRIILLFIINFAALLRLNTRLAWLSVIVVPFIVAVSILFFKRVTKAYEAYQEQDAVLSTTLQENLSGVRVVKAFSRQDFEMEKFKRDNWEKFVRGKKLFTLHSLFWPVSDVLCSVQMLAGYLIGALMAINGEISVGSYLAYAGLIVWIIFPMRNLGRLIVQTSNGLVSYDRVMTIIKENREPLDKGRLHPSKPLKGKVVFDKVSFEYEKGQPVLNEVSFVCNPGMAVALLGSTGSGKTSLVNLLPRFYEISSGQVLLDGHRLKDYPRRYLRQQIGIVEQEPFLFSRSIRDNITYGVDRKVSQNEIEQAARAAAIHDVILSFPEGYKTLVGERGVTLSGGQKQRVTIARTLLKNPRILIMDDSTSSVDTETEAEIRQAMLNLSRDRTTFIIAHRIQSIMTADLILVLEHGRVVQMGKHGDLTQQEGIYRQIFEIQTKIEVELDKEISSAS